ncbi:MAG: hypothetical protein WKF69_12515 [Daejeonella sp.]
MIRKSPKPGTEWQNWFLVKKSASMCQKVTATIKKLDELIDAMPVDKTETDYVSIYLAYGFYRIKVEYFS